MARVNIYLSVPFKHWEEMRKLHNYIKEKLYSLPIKLRLPKYDDDEDAVYVYSDLHSLSKSDILILHVPEPSVGACAEFGYFLGIKSNPLIICYKCMEHTWLDKLCSYRVDKPEKVVKIIEDYIYHLG